ncbi:unnamed protein product [Anisakis simplex]|uniref:Kinesin motor domain-containing protein n=1 Tax=Anisakis simplex TaxID=6269 RepID=A0A0M3KJR1_ANISI|nr:unnamed protein product [Anisakis simplex]
MSCNILGDLQSRSSDSDSDSQCEASAAFHPARRHHLQLQRSSESDNEKSIGSASDVNLITITNLTDFNQVPPDSSNRILRSVSCVLEEQLKKAAQMGTPIKNLLRVADLRFKGTKLVFYEPSLSGKTF